MFLLHCIFISTQVVVTVDDKNPLDQVVPPSGDGLNHDLAAYITSKTSKLSLLQNSKQVNIYFAHINLLCLASASPFVRD